MTTALDTYEVIECKHKIAQQVYLNVKILTEMFLAG